MKADVIKWHWQNTIYLHTYGPSIYGVCGAAQHTLAP